MDTQRHRSLLCWKTQSGKAVAALYAERLEFSRDDYNACTDNYKFCCNDEQFAWLTLVFKPYSTTMALDGTGRVIVDALKAPEYHGQPYKWVMTTREAHHASYDAKM